MSDDELVDEIIDSILNNPNKTNIWEDITPEIHSKVIEKLKLLGWEE